MQKTGSKKKKQRVAARKSQILGAAARLFARKGFHRTTTRDIADAANLAEGTLYNYFSSKDELLLGIVAQLAEAQNTNPVASQDLPKDAHDFFLGLLSQRRSFMEQYDEMLQAVLTEVMSNPALRQEYTQQFVEPFSEMLEKQLELRIQMGQLKDFDPALISRLIVGTMFGLYLLDSFGDEVVSTRREDIAEAFAGMVVGGVGGTTGR